MATKMGKRELANCIRCWLQKFGSRDNETFYAEVIVGEITWELSMQYNYDETGCQLEPYDWCRVSGSKTMSNTSIEDRTEEELYDIYLRLLVMKHQY